jgi:uncharacterized membrane protein (UPF0127 family)
MKISHFRNGITLLFENPKTSNYMTWTVKVKEIVTVIMLLNFTIKYNQEFIIERIRKAQKEKEKEVLKIRGGWIDDKGVLHGQMLEFIASKHLNPVAKHGNVIV